MKPKQHTRAFFRGSRPSRLRGLGLIGLFFVAVLVIFVSVVGMRVVPAHSEYASVKRLVEQVAVQGGSSPDEIRKSFDRRRSLEFGVESVTGENLDITKENDKVVVSFAYNREIPLFGRYFLLIKYDGRSGGR
jgi:hypothetical protein